MMKQPWDNLPEKFLEKLPLYLSEREQKQILEALSQKRPSTFRVNTLKTTRNTLLKELKLLKIDVESVRWYDDAFILKNVPQKVLTESSLYADGNLYVQSLSSMIPPLVLNPQKNETILDLTAAPGSKTTQIAALMGNTGEILANDKSRVRMYKLEANLTIQGVTNVRTLSLPGEIVWKKFPEFFDKTLVDVPCSMEGRFFTQDPKTYEDWTNGKVKMLSEMQKWLLRSAISSTKVGGIIVYSTCTISPEENEGVIDWILKKERGNIELESIVIKNLPMTSGVTKFANRVFDEQVKKTARILPSSSMEGFFITKIRKIRPTVSEDTLPLHPSHR